MADAPNVQAPIIVPLGKASRRNIRKLKQGRGRLMDDVTDAVDVIRRDLAEKPGGDGKEIVPVILVYKRKRRKSKSSAFFPFL